MSAGRIQMPNRDEVRYGIGDKRQKFWRSIESGHLPIGVDDWHYAGASPEKVRDFVHAVKFPLEKKFKVMEQLNEIIRRKR